MTVDREVGHVIVREAHEVLVGLQVMSRCVSRVKLVDRIEVLAANVMIQRIARSIVIITLVAVAVQRLGQDRHIHMELPRALGAYLNFLTITTRCKTL